MRMCNRYVASVFTGLAVVLAAAASSAQTRPGTRSIGQRQVPVAQRSTRTASVPNQTTPSTNRAAPAVKPTSRIAVIDISYVFKNHARFKQTMEDMKKDVEAFEAELKQNGAQLQKYQEQLREHHAGSPEYKRIAEQIAGFQGQVQAKTQLKRNEFLQKEARIYYNVYKEILDEVAFFAQRHGIELVVRFNSEPIDPENRKSVLEGVNRAVVFQRHLNITFDILERLNGPRMTNDADQSGTRR